MSKKGRKYKIKISQPSDLAWNVQFDGIYLYKNIQYRYIYIYLHKVIDTYFVIYFNKFNISVKNLLILEYNSCQLEKESVNESFFCQNKRRNIHYYE